MSYVDQKNGPSPTGLASAVIVQAAIGALIVTGLTVSQAIIADPPRVDTFDVKKDPPPPAPPPPEQTETVPEAPTTPPITVPTPPFEFDTVRPRIDTTDLVLPPQPPMPPIGDRIVPTPSPAATFTPVGAKPRNDPGAWLRDRDYRSSWVRQELTGVASFRLDIAASGKVTGCRISGSTGHSQLDEATCRLVQQRAKFEPARGSNGEPVSGQYTGSVLWQLPE
ncbi:MAG: energy transducer TonB [Erythrobacter sp.]|nr:energy transducer TonB [Erythrobacter sp.]NNC52056.1 energy transducer TonB [Erythrobacter sp.]